MMHKRLAGIIFAVALAAAAFAGCGAKSEKTVDAAPQSAVNPAKVEFSEAYGENRGSDGSAADAEKPASTEAADSLAGGGNTLDNLSNAILAERKIIRSANLTIEVENFDEAIENINSIILGIGIIQESNINAERFVIDGKLKLIKRGTIVLRVDKDKFDNVINSLKGIGVVYNQTINGQDVTDKYIDIESRLRLLKLEQSRLETYLMKLEDLDQIFKTESRLTEIRQEIESLTGNLNKMSSLVELSTITITMNEKNPYSKTEPETYGEKLLNRLKGSLSDVVEFLGNLLIFIVAAIPVLIVLGLFILLGIFIIRRISGRRREPAVMLKNPDSGEDKTKNTDAR